MFVFYDKQTGEVVYTSGTITGLDPNMTPDLMERIETSEWVNNVLPLGHTPDTVQVRWLDERDTAQYELAQRVLQEEVVFDVSSGRMARDRLGDTMTFKSKRVPAPMPEALAKHGQAGTRLKELRKKGAAAMTPLERNEVLDLMLLERTPPHELI